MTLFILEIKNKKFALRWFGKGYIYKKLKLKKKHFLINSLIHLKLNSLKRIFF